MCSLFVARCLLLFVRCCAVVSFRVCFVVVDCCLFVVVSVVSCFFVVCVGYLVLLSFWCLVLVVLLVLGYCYRPLLVLGCWLLVVF